MGRNVDEFGFLCDEDDPEPMPWRDSPAEAIRKECDRIRDMLLEKNKAYGNSFSRPLRIFSKADPEEQLLVRIDDKLSRIARGDLADPEDTILDLCGYLILLRVLRGQ